MELSWFNYSYSLMIFIRDISIKVGREDFRLCKTEKKMRDEPPRDWPI